MVSPRHIADADAFLRRGGVIDPARYTAAFAPGMVLAANPVSTRRTD
jgi:hypothetical protein